MPKHVYVIRAILVYLGFIGLFVVLGRHVYWLQVTRHVELAEKARRTYTAEHHYTGRRGAIVDCLGNMLAGGLACKDILAEPRRLPAERLEYVRDLLAQRLELPAEQLEQRFRSGRVEVVVKREVDMATARSLEELRLPGLRFVDSRRRYYPKDSLLANVLGFVDADSRGAFGLEKNWDEVLSPRTKSASYERDRKGRQLFRETPQREPLLDGHTVWLTINEPIQSIVEEELTKLYEEHQPRYAYAIMADPKTGALMAMAQHPTFNANDREQMNPDHWQNHIISDVYDPGSTMKPMAIGAAIDFGLVTLDTVINCENGHWYYAGKPLRDSGHSFGLLKVAEVIQHSSNIGTAKIGLILGENRLYQALRRFGFGTRTEVGLFPESPGILRPVAQWDKLSITRFPIGQGISVTPLQMVQAYSALACDGRVPQLHLVRRITDAKGQEVASFAPPPQNLAIRAPAAHEIVKALCLVTTEEGTAGNAGIPGYRVAGKTGTSQKLVDGSYEGHHKYVSSFIGFVPAENPAFVLLVVADEPSAGKYYGGTVSAPYFRRIAEQTLRYLNVPPQGGTGTDGVVAVRESL